MFDSLLSRWSLFLVSLNTISTITKVHPNEATGKNTNKCDGSADLNDICYTLTARVLKH